MEPLRPVEPVEAVLAQVAQSHAAGKVVLHEPGGRAREQDLAPVPGVADPGGLVHREADVPVLAEGRLARVQPHPHLDDRAVRPLLRHQAPLSGDRGLERGARAAEDREERVALPVDLDPARLLEREPEHLVVEAEHLPVLLAAELLQELRRALDVAEQEGDGSGRKVAHGWVPEGT